MRRVQISLKPSNLNSYLDLFTNHGHLLVFPWLVAHNFQFFKSFDYLTLLDTLLIHRRGFNPKIGSKIRKVYFSDVNRILIHCGELKISCIETLKPSSAYENSFDTSDCLVCLHKVEDRECYEVIIDDLNLKLDDYDFEVKKPKEKPSIKIEMHKNAFPEEKRLTGLARLLKVSKMKIEDLFDSKDIRRFDKNDKNREIKLREIRDEINSISLQYNELPAKNRLLFDEFIGSYSKSRLSNLLEIIGGLITFFDKFDEVTLPLKELSEIYSKKSKKFFEEENEAVIVEHLTKYLDNKKREGFYLFDELLHRWKKHCLVERVDYYNEENDKRNKLLEECKREKVSANSTKGMEYKSLKNVCDKLRAEVAPMMQAYDEIDLTFETLKGLKRPIILKQIINMFLDKDDQGFDYWAILLRGKVTRSEMIESLKEVEKEILTSMSIKPSNLEIELKNLITGVYEKERDYILQTVNKNENIDKVRLEKSFESIVEYRKKYLRKKQKGIFKLENVGLNAIEMAKMKVISKYLIDNEYTYMSNLNYLEQKTMKFIYCSQNLRNFGFSLGTSFEEWTKVMYEREKPKMVTLNAEYEKAIKTFEQTCGISPYGLIIGSRSENEEHNKCEKDVQIALGETIMITDVVSEIVNIAASKDMNKVDPNWLAVAKHGKILDLDRRMDDLKSKLVKKRSELEEQVAVLNEVRGSESYYLALRNSRTEPVDDYMTRFDVPKSSERQIQRKSGINVFSGKKIERDYAIKLIKRKHADDIFQETVKKVAIESKNIYQELEVEEAIVDSNNIVNQILNTSDVVPYYFSDFKRRRKYRLNKIQKLADESMKEDFDLIRVCNKFDVENNSRANKKYNVTGVISYIKVLLALRLLKINTKRNIYEKFGLKESQSTYMRNSLIKLLESELNKVKWSEK